LPSSGDARLIRALLDVDVRFDAIVFFLLCPVDSLDCVEDCSEFSDADGGSLDPNAGGAGSDAFAAEAICFQISAELVIEFVPGAVDVWVCSTLGDAFWFAAAATAGDAFGVD
jgi:hypothetical protein